MLLLSFSGPGEASLTLKSLETLEHHPEVVPFDKCIIKPNFDFSKDFDAVIEKMKNADAIIWAVSPFHMSIPSHMLYFFDMCRKQNLYLDCPNSYFITSMHIGDTFLTRVLEIHIKSISSIYIPGLSYTTPDIINRELTLYNLGTPDSPPKKNLFKKETSKWKEGEGMHKAVQWYKILKDFVILKKEQITPKTNPKNVLFVDMDEDTNERTAFLLDALEKAKSFYKKQGCSIVDIAQKDFNIKPCDGCKICYASKECKIKDDYLKYEKHINEADIIIYYGLCHYGTTSAISKACIDRSVKNGLMPLKGKMPYKVENFKAIGYIIDTDINSYAIFKDYEYGLRSFNFEHFIGIFADVSDWNKDDDLYTMLWYSLLSTRDKMYPARNFYSEKIGKHFSDLSRNIPTVLPDENKFYYNVGSFKDIPIDPNARTIMPDTYKIGQQMRMIPYNKAIESLDKLKQGE